MMPGGCVKGWEMFCDHANEVPNVCPCPPQCGCKNTHCRPRDFADVLLDNITKQKKEEEAKMGQGLIKTDMFRLLIDVYEYLHVQKDMNIWGRKELIKRVNQALNELEEL